MNMLNKSLLILLIIQFAACTAPAAKIYSDRNPDIDISGATTFAWLKDEYLLVSSEESNPIVAAKVAKAIEFEMRKKRLCPRQRSGNGRSCGSVYCW